jgi:hypothetical protein
MYLADQEYGEHGIGHKGCCPRATHVLTRPRLQSLRHRHRQHEFRHGGGHGEERVGAAKIERDTSLWHALKAEPKAVLWSVAVSTAM